MDVKRFEVSIPQEQLDDLRERPRRTCWTDELTGVGWSRGMAVFIRDPPTRRSAEQNNFVRWSEFDRGCHFAAMEAPDLPIDDVRAFFRGLR